MEYFSITADFLNIGSVSAFMGALAAFLLVAFTDQRRRSKRLKTLRESLQGTLELAKRKADSVSKTRDLLGKHDTLNPGEVQTFPVGMLEALLVDLYSEIPQAERASIDALLFRMRAIDSLLEGIRMNAERLYRLYIDKKVGDESTALKRYILIDFEAVLSNLSHLNELGDLFLNGDYEGMSKWRFRTSPSEAIRTE